MNINNFFKGNSGFYTFLNQIKNSFIPIKNSERIIENNFIIQNFPARLECEKDFFRRKGCENLYLYDTHKLLT